MSETRLQLKIDPETMAMIKDLANSEKDSISNYVRRLIRTQFAYRHGVIKSLDLDRMPFQTAQHASEPELGRLRRTVEQS